MQNLRGSMNTFEVYKRQLEVASREFSDIIEHGHGHLMAAERGLPNLLESVSGYGGGGYGAD